MVFVQIRNTYVDKCLVSASKASDAPKLSTCHGNGGNQVGICKLRLIQQNKNVEKVDSVLLFILFSTGCGRVMAKYDVITCVLITMRSRTSYL